MKPKPRTRTNWKERYREMEELLDIYKAEWYVLQCDILRYGAAMELMEQVTMSAGTKIQKLESDLDSWKKEWVKSTDCRYAWIKECLERRDEIKALEADVLRQREELIKLRGPVAERVSC